VEDQVGPNPVKIPLRTPTQPDISNNSGWIVSPWFDLLFLANVGWVVLLWPGLLPTGRAELATEFWAVYFLIAPHRWITLVLAAFDPDRRAGRPAWLFVGLAVLAAGIVLGVRTVTGAFACLALIDYLWNAWHFASQHQGVLRMYSLKVGGGPVWLERHAVRAFLCYVLIRTAGWTTGWVESATDVKQWIDTCDLLFLAVPGAVLTANAYRMPAVRIGKLVYLISLLSLYSGLLLALRNDWRNLVIALAAATSAFHATEYLAVVSHYARRRVNGGSTGLFRKMAERWIGLLGLYVLVLGGLGVAMAHPDSGLTEVWFGLNLWAAFLHYAYDGLIWKLRRPATAAVLGVSA